MARKAIYLHATQVNTGTHPDDGTSPVGSNEWNADPDPQGMIGCTPATSTITIASGVATITDSVAVIAAESSTSDTLDKVAITNTNQYDLVYLFADTGDTITLTNTSSPSADGHVKTVTGADETLSETVPTILMRKGNYWYGYGGSITPTDITVADTTDTTCFPSLFESATGDLAPKTDAGLTYNAGTGMLTATGLTGPLTGNASTVTTNANLTGDVTSSGNATTIASGAVELSMIANAAKTEALIVAASDNTTALTVGTVFTFYMPYAMTLTDIKASVLTAPTGAELIVDVHDAGTTIMATNKLDIDVSEFHTKDAGTQPVLSDTALANNAKIEIIVDQIGSTVAGAGLVIYLIGYQT